MSLAENEIAQRVVIQKTLRFVVMTFDPKQAIIRTHDRPSCPLCGAAGKIVHTGLTDFLFNAPGQWTMKQCPQPDCQLAWLDPFPLVADLHLAYQSYYTHEEVQSGSTALRRFAFSAYRLALFVPAWVVGLSKEREKLQALFLGGREPGRLLDVGCGDGGFLFGMKKKGWEVQGVDFDPKAIENAKKLYGLDLKTGDLKGARFPEKSFDAITLHHVIEHVPDPVEEFSECWRLLKPGGLIVALTPNVTSLGHAEFGRYWRGLEIPRHLHLFSPNSLRRCAEKAGLKVVQASSSAGNADIIGGASFSIRSAPDHHLSMYPRPSLSRTLRAILFQYREHFRLKTGVQCGEEAVLIATRDSK